MLVITGIIPEVKKLLDEIPKWNPSPLHFYFPFTLYNDNSDNGDSSEDALFRESISYRFEASSKLSGTHWIWHATVLVIMIKFALYQAIFEDDSYVQYVIHIALVVVLNSSMIFAYAYNFHMESFLKYFNELLFFEARYVDFNCRQEHKFWKQNPNKRWPLLSIQIQRKFLPMVGLYIVATLTAFPYIFWHLLPLGILSQFAKLNFGGTSGYILEEVTRRLASFAWAYICCYVNLNLYMIVIILSFLMAPSSMLFMLIAWRKRLKSTGRNIPGNVRMFREIQLIAWFYNDLHKLGIIPAILVLVLSDLPVSISSIVTRWKYMDPQAAILFGAGVVMSAEVILLAFHIPLKIYATSKQLLVPTSGRSLGRPILYLNKRDTKMMNRYWRSFPVLKIYFFESNFFESNTPLVLLDFSISCAINLILLAK